MKNCCPTCRKYRGKLVGPRISDIDLKFLSGDEKNDGRKIFDYRDGVKIELENWKGLYISNFRSGFNRRLNNNLDETFVENAKYFCTPSRFK